MKQTGAHKKKEERFNPSGQLLWDKGELERPSAPCSNVHKQTVTTGESKNSKDHRRENWDQPDENGPQIVTKEDQDPEEERRKDST